jgi:hypothetical protein
VQSVEVLKYCRITGLSSWMASASFKLSLALDETGSAAFVTLHCVLGRASGQ